MGNEILKMIRLARKHPTRPFYKSFTPLSVLPAGDWDWTFERVKCDFVISLIEAKGVPWLDIKRAFKRNRHVFYDCYVAKARVIVGKYKSKKEMTLADRLL